MDDGRKHAGKFCEPKKLVVGGSSVLEIGVAVGVLLVLTSVLFKKFDFAFLTLIHLGILVKGGNCLLLASHIG